MAERRNRRQFIQTSAAAGVGFWVAGGLSAKESKAANEQIQIGCIGVGGKGDSDAKNASRDGKIVAVCDVDRATLDRSAGRYKAEKFTDYREMLDKMGDKFDAVTVSTPDHCHAVAAAKAMKMGKHCYCQKPLTHSIYEARTLGDIASKQGVASQMGNQYTAYNPMRKAAFQIRDGQLGKVSEVHIWTNRPVWPQGEKRGEPKDVPANLDWEAWIGPAPMRPYADGYHPFKWRGWWDFGTGALGDMACHTANLPFMALNMKNPTSVQATTSGHDKDSYPTWSTITFEFPELDGRAPFTMKWYDGGKRPDLSVLEGVEKPAASGCVIVGDKGRLYAAGDYAERGHQHFGYEPKDVDYPKSPGHVEEWFQAMRGGEPAMSNFPDYGGPLTETILLGNLAVWAADKPESPGKKVAWDAEKLEATNAPELQKIVRRDYRDGYSL